MNKYFVIGMVFEKIETKKIKGKANDFPTSPNGEYNIPLLTAGVENQGLARYAMKSQCSTILSNVISVSANGANSGVVFYHPEEFAVLQDAYAIKVRNYEIPNIEVGLYLTSALYKAIASTHNWNYKAGWNRIKDDSFSLPVKVDTDGNPIIDNTCFYHKDGYIPDWEYMKNYIRELKQECIIEQERNNATELENYLIAAGLNDYKLTEEDKSVLAAKLVDGGVLSRNSISTDGCLKEGRKFKIDDLFKKEKLGWTASRKFNKEKDVSKEQTKEFDLPLINAKDGNNGIMYYGRSTDFSYVDSGIDIVNDGVVSTGNVYAQPHKIGVLYNAYIINLKNGMKRKELYGYLAAAIKKSIKPQFNYSNKAGWDKVKKCDILLPIQTNPDGRPIIDPDRTYHPDGYIPDWEYMEKYIKATEKEIIKEVVMYKDEVIAKAKEIAGAA